MIRPQEMKKKSAQLGTNFGIEKLCADWILKHWKQLMV